MMIAAIIINSIFLLPLLSLVLPSPSSPSEYENSSKQTTTRTTKTTFILQFDGSFRPPKDPGVSTIPRRLAVAAAYLSMTLTYNENVVTLLPVAVGTKILPVDIGMSSQHVELEGLLLGLNYINEHWIELMEKRERMLEASYFGEADQLTLKIQGDCKTVIDQLTGKAVPRKLEAGMNQVQNVLDQLLSRGDSIVLGYNLVPRHENHVCDCLCSNLINIVVSKAWSECIDDLEKVQQDDSYGPSRQDHYLSRPVSRILSSHLDSCSSVIKYSLRYPLFEKLAIIALDSKDYESLITIGERLNEEVQRWCRQKATLTAVKKRSAVYQVEGWKGLRNSKKTRFLEHKHRILFQTHSTVDHGHPVLSYDELRSLGYCEEEWERDIPKQLMDLLSTWFRETMKRGGKDASPFWVHDGRSN